MPFNTSFGNDFDMADPLMFLNIASATMSHRSIIKKESTLKLSSEIELNNSKRREQKYQKPNRKVQFADLLLVSDVDEYIKNEEQGYRKVTKNNRKQKTHSSQDSTDQDLARKDGLDKNSILGKRRRNEKSY